MDARYARNVLLDGLGVNGQQRLCKATVLVIGIGGVGCATAVELAGLGVNLVLCDNDKVEKTNLNRQFLFNEEDIGSSKVAAARKALHRFNPRIKIGVATDFKKLDFRKFDVVVDCTDAYETRMAVSRECERKKVPLIYASAVGYVARVALFKKRYLHRMASGGREGGNACETAGVFPPASAVAGSIAASETVKQILNDEKTIEGKMFVIDLEKDKMKILKI